MERENLKQHDQCFSGLKKVLSENYPLSQVEWTILKESIRERKVSKHLTFLGNGEREICGRYIISGVVKITSHTAEPYVYDFRSAGDYLCDVVSLVKQNKSEFSFETITDCVWLELGAHTLMKLNPRIANVFSMVVIDHLKNDYKRNAFLRISDAEERYLEFCRSHPDVIKYAKLRDIASFLDITQQSLSRLRRKCLSH